jgi:hypothetical protein
MGRGENCVSDLDLGDVQRFGFTALDMDDINVKYVEALMLEAGWKIHRLRRNKNSESEVAIYEESLKVLRNSSAREKLKDKENFTPGAHNFLNGLVYSALIEANEGNFEGYFRRALTAVGAETSASSHIVADPNQGEIHLRDAADSLETICGEEIEKTWIQMIRGSATNGPASTHCEECFKKGRAQRKNKTLKREVRESFAFRSSTPEEEQDFYQGIIDQMRDVARSAVDQEELEELLANPRQIENYAAAMIAPVAASHMLALDPVERFSKLFDFEDMNSWMYFSNKGFVKQGESKLELVLKNLTLLKKEIFHFYGHVEDLPWPEEEKLAEILVDLFEDKSVLDYNPLLARVQAIGAIAGYAWPTGAKEFDDKTEARDPVIAALIQSIRFQSARS